MSNLYLTTKTKNYDGFFVGDFSFNATTPIYTRTYSNGDTVGLTYDGTAGVRQLVINYNYSHETDGSATFETLLNGVSTLGSLEEFPGDVTTLYFNPGDMETANSATVQSTAANKFITLSGSVLTLEDETGFRFYSRQFTDEGNFRIHVEVLEIGAG